ncbi:unnamed protein product [Clonostachys byssicola]|uniref:Nephrocystin 3-like N-terminal domain-containing protein n=1 Tax=Clonostachys byssicola TaxID=160290 RepID=A0A9N9UF74_9HYPO|nr:unnamed protein product [Clonostachys byssicola]
MSGRRRNVVYRLRGLPLNVSDTEADAVLRTLLSDKELQSIRPKIRLVPSCYRDDPTSTAFVTLESTPSFLADLDKEPLEDWQEEVEIGDEVLDINFDRHFHGFTQLYRTNPNSLVKADIITLSGLDGHAFGSWRGKGKLRRMWLQDFLEGDIPDCRTMIYGYNSRLQSRGVNTMFDYCAEFIQELEKIRSSWEEISRPLILIGHSFGGLIVAQALVKAKQLDRDPNPTIRALYDAIIGIMFFATPHRGILIDDIRSMVGDQGANPRTLLVDQIQSGSQQLKDQLDHFKNLIQGRKIISFIEMQQTKSLVRNSETGVWSRSGDYITVLEPMAALLDLPDHDEIKIRVDADHSSIVKFDSKHDPTYRSAVLYLRQLERVATQKLEGKHTLGQSVPPHQPTARQSTGDEVSESSIDRTGLTVLYEPNNAIADIVLVSGLGGHPWRTWAYGVTEADDPMGTPTCSAYWPKQFLPTQCDNARIMTFGFVQETHDISNLLAKAPELLSALVRSRPLGRSIIFITHCLGGILVKETLRLAEIGSTLQMKDIVSYTFAVIFFSTPHHGDGDGSSLADVSNKMLQHLEPETQSSLANPSAELQNSLDTCQRTFISQFKKNGYQIKDFVENVDTILPKAVTAFDLRAEMINKSHSEICRFEAPDDPGYRQVSNALQAFMMSVKGQQLYLRDQCLASLFFPELENRESDITPALEKTGDWIFNNPDFVNWSKWKDTAQRPNNIIWLKGKPGSGKSTLMKKALYHSKALGLSDSVSVAGFFFTTRGNIQLQKTPAGLFRTILFDLLKQDKALLSAFILEFVKKRATPGCTVSWRVVELEDFLRSAYSGQIQSIQKAVIYVDALDECDNVDGQDIVRDLVHYFRSLTEGPLIKVCLCSRHYPHIKIPDCPQIVVEAFNSQDVLHFVNTKLCPESKQDRSRRYAKAIASRADGVFLWVILVVKSLNIDLDNERTDEEIEETLNTLPQKLEDLFGSLFIGKRSKIEMQKAALIFSLILTSARPLNQHEIRHGLSLSANDTAPPSEAEQWQDSSYCLPFEAEAFLTSLRFYTRGLAEVSFRGGAHDTGFASKRLSFKRKWTRDLSKSSIDEGRHPLLRPLKIEDLLNPSIEEEDNENNEKEKEKEKEQGKEKEEEKREEISFHKPSESRLSPYDTKFPDEFKPRRSLNQRQPNRKVGVATEGLYGDNLGSVQFIHESVREYFLSKGFLALDKVNTPPSLAERHLKYIDVCMRVISLSPSSRKGDDIPKLWRQFPLVPYAGNNLPYHISEAELGGSVSEKLIYGLITEGPSGFWAKWRNCLEALKTSEQLKELTKTVDPTYILDSPPFHFLCQMGFFLSAESFLRHGGNIDSRDAYMKTALHHAIENASIKTVEFLTQRNVDLHAKDRKGNTPLHRAASCKVSKRTMDILLAPIFQDTSCLSDVNASGNTPLHEAASSGNSNLVQALLSQGAALNTTNKTGSTSLHLAASRGYDDIVQFLLEAGAEPNVMNDDGAMPLYLACQAGHGTTVASILRLPSIDPNLPNAQGDAPIHIAAEGQNISPIQELFRRNANINARNRRWLTPIHLRITAGLQIKFLVASGANIEARTPSGQTPLHLAANCDHIDAAAALINGGANISAVDYDGKTVLHYAVGKENFGRWFLTNILRREIKIDVSKPDKKGRTPLHYAAQAGYPTVFKMLLGAGGEGDLARKDRYNCTPVDYATSETIDSMRYILEAKGYKRVMRLVNGTMKRVYEAPRQPVG